MHHYGRHGPRAWLKWRKRHSVRPSHLPVPVVPPKTMVVRIVAPATTERIIVILMPESNPQSNEAQRVGTQETQIVESSSGQASIISIPISPQDEREKQQTSPIYRLLQQEANHRVIDDIDEIERMVRGGKFIILDWELLIDRARRFAKKDFSSDYFRNDPTMEYATWIKAYQNAYLRDFDGGIHPLADYVTRIKDERERQLRDILSRDRVLVQTRAPGDWHARDLVLVRILQIYYPHRLGEVDITDLLERHAFIDRYEKYILDFTGRNEVIWPDPDSF